MTGPALLEVRDLTVVYRRRRAQLVAVDGVSFDVHAGQTVGLVGESGSGKSTIANALMGLAPVHAGSITFAGREISALSPGERRVTLGSDPTRRLLLASDDTVRLDAETVLLGSDAVAVLDSGR